MLLLLNMLFNIPRLLFYLLRASEHRPVCVCGYMLILISCDQNFFTCRFLQNMRITWRLLFKLGVQLLFPYLLTVKFISKTNDRMDDVIFGIGSGCASFLQHPVFFYMMSHNIQNGKLVQQMFI